jgi:hypothetical protein
LHSFDRISARFEAMAVVYDPAKFTIENDLLPELPGLLELTAAFVRFFDYSVKAAQVADTLGRFLGDLA